MSEQFDRIAVGLCLGIIILVAFIAVSSQFNRPAISPRSGPKVVGAEIVIDTVVYQENTTTLTQTMTGLQLTVSNTTGGS